MNLDIRDSVGVLTLDRPAKRNALTEDFVDELMDAIEQVESKGCVSAVLQAEGSVFCAGADRAAVGRHAHEKEDPTAPVERKPAIDIVLRLKESPVYWVAAVQGPAVGAGVSLVAVCSAAIATRDAWLSIPEIDYGLFPEFLMGLVVPLIGRRRAFHLATTGRRFSAEEAYAMGLLSALEASTSDAQAVAFEHAASVAAKPIFAKDASRWWGLLGEPAQSA